MMYDTSGIVDHERVDALKSLLRDPYVLKQMIDRRMDADGGPLAEVSGLLRMINEDCGGERYYPSPWPTKEEVESLARAIPTQWHTINKALDGGMPKGATIAIHAKSGSSKSTHAYYTCADAFRKGMRVAYCDGEMGKTFTLLGIIRAILGGRWDELGKELGKTPTLEQIQAFVRKHIPDFEKRFIYVNSGTEGRREALEAGKIVRTMDLYEFDILVVDYLGKVDRVEEGKSDYYQRQQKTLEDFAMLVEKKGALLYFYGQYNRGGYSEDADEKDTKASFMSGTMSQLFDTWLTFEIQIDKKTKTTLLKVDKRRFSCPVFEASYQWVESSPLLHDTRGYLTLIKETLKEEQEQAEAQDMTEHKIAFISALKAWIDGGCSSIKMGEFVIPTPEGAFERTKFMTCFAEWRGDETLTQKWDKRWLPMVVKLGLVDCQVGRNKGLRYGGTNAAN